MLLSARSHILCERAESLLVLLALLWRKDTTKRDIDLVNLIAMRFFARLNLL